MTNASDTTVQFLTEVSEWWDRLAPRNRLLLLSALGLADHRYNCLREWNAVSSNLRNILVERITKIVIAFECRQPPPAPQELSTYLLDYPLHPNKNKSIH